MPASEPHHVINTTENIYEEEPAEILAIVPATGWVAQLEDGSTVPLLVFALTDEGDVYGVVLGPDGRVDITRDNVEEDPRFSKYVQANQQTKGS